MDILDDVISSEPVVPAANAQAAALYWRGGRFDAARRQAEMVLGGDLPDYLRIGGLVVAALCERREGATASAHNLLEEALALGTTQALLRPFRQPDKELSALLAEHADLGTDHEPFLAQAVTLQRAATSTTIDPLSARERQVLGLLQTRLTATEIAAQLHISPNTLKSHVKAIYRKLGVESRREAVRLARSADPVTALPALSGSGS
jgi:LuxR family maltose regulon positive regulatory protein